MWWLIGWGVIAAILIGVSCYRAGRGEDHDGFEMLVIVSAFWPVVLVLAIVMAPFLALHSLGEKHRGRA